MHVELKIWMKRLNMGEKMVLFWIYIICSNFSEDWKQVLSFQCFQFCFLSRLGSEILKWAIYTRQYVKSFGIHHLATCFPTISFWDWMFSISKIKGYQREGATDVLALKYCTCLYSPPPVTLKYEKAKPMGKILPGKATSVKYVIGILHKKKSGVLCH